MSVVPQPQLFGVAKQRPRGQILKWVGNKIRYAEAIAAQFPDYETYFEPFVGTGAVLATLAPGRAVASDMILPLIELLKLVQRDPDALLDHYERHATAIAAEGNSAYLLVRDRYNDQPSPHDLLVISRTCYGGVMRFTREGSISTPLGPHRPMSRVKLETFMREWQERLQGTEFVVQDYRQTLQMADRGDLAYCDPPYVHGQSILYGAQDFEIGALWKAVAAAKERGVAVAVSVDGYRRSGSREIELRLPSDLFERELLIDRGGCMLRRFQLKTHVRDEGVADRLLLTW